MPGAGVGVVDHAGESRRGATGARPGAMPASTADATSGWANRTTRSSPTTSRPSATAAATEARASGSPLPGDRLGGRRPERGGDAQHVTHPVAQRGRPARQRRPPATAGPGRREGRRTGEPSRASSIAYSGLPPDSSCSRSKRGPRQRADDRRDHLAGALDRQRADEELLAAIGAGSCARPVASTRPSVPWPAPGRAPGRGAGTRSARRLPTPDRSTARRRSRRGPGDPAANRRSAASTVRPRS